MITFRIIRTSDEWETRDRPPAPTARRDWDDRNAKESWFVDLKSLDDLIALDAATGNHGVILTVNRKDPADFPTLEVYDTYKE